MKLIMKTSMQGPKIGLSPGDDHECGDAEAIRLIDAGFAAAEDPDEEAEVRKRMEDPAAAEKAAAEKAAAEKAAAEKAAAEKAQQGGADQSGKPASTAKKAGAKK